MQLRSIFIHPLKSCAARALETAAVQTRGLEHDRRWMIVDDESRFVSGRELPQLVRLLADADAAGLRLSASDDRIVIPRPRTDARRMPVSLWKDRIDALDAGEPAARWLTSRFGRPLRLVYMDEAAVRPVTPDHSQPGDEVSFADGYPLLLIAQASLDALNARLATPVPMTRFRPNLVVDGVEPHAEDGWRRLRIGEVEFEAVKPCVRCVFTTVDTERGEFDSGGEPLRTLKTYRRGPKGISFGVNLIPRGTGTLRCGDAIELD